jgi:hypothetical protein
VVLDDSDKLMYLIGLTEGIISYAVDLTVKHPQAETWIRAENRIWDSSNSLEEIISEIDGLYINPANLNIHVASIYKLVCALDQGISPSEKEDQLRQLRPRYSKPDQN